jgi:hypothetical protein
MEIPEINQYTYKELILSKHAKKSASLTNGAGYPHVED